MWGRSLMFMLLMVGMGCGKPIPEITGIDLKSWKEDRGGCNGYRKSVQLQLDNQRNKLKGLSEDDLFEMLGRPDENELYKRNQKFYYYWVYGGPTCEASDSTLRLSIRFNAMGLAQLVTME